MDIARAERFVGGEGTIGSVKAFTAEPREESINNEENIIL